VRFSSTRFRFITASGLQGFGVKDFKDFKVLDIFIGLVLPQPEKNLLGIPRA